MTFDPRTIWKKAATRAAMATGNVASGAGALVASAALWNPLPVILWGIGSAAWVLFASTSGPYTRRVLEEEREAAEAKAEGEREALRQSVVAALAQSPFSGWIRAGLLPDYLQSFVRLAGIRDRVVRLLADRQEEYLAGLGIQKQLTYMLTAYLQFVRARIGYLQVLIDLPQSGQAGEEAGGAPASPAGSGRGVTTPAGASGGSSAGAAGGVSGTGGQPGPGMPRRVRPFGPPAPRPVPPLAAVPAALPRVEDRLAEIEARIAALRALAAQEPATARTREWHIGILQKQEELLRDCQRRDQQVVAQLTAVPDVFDVILGRVSAAQFSATEVATYMGGVVEQIEETERFVESMRPAVEEMRVNLQSGIAG